MWLISWFLPRRLRAHVDPIRPYLNDNIVFWLMQDAGLLVLQVKVKTKSATASGTIGTKDAKSSPKRQAKWMLRRCRRMDKRRKEDPLRSDMEVARLKTELPKAVESETSLTIRSKLRLI